MISTTVKSFILINFNFNFNFFKKKRYHFYDIFSYKKLYLLCVFLLIYLCDLPLIILVIFSLFLIFIYNHFVESLMSIHKNRKLINLVICKNQILTLTSFKKRLIILVIHEKKLSLVPLKDTCLL